MTSRSKLDGQWKSIREVQQIFALLRTAIDVALSESSLGSSSFCTLKYIYQASTRSSLLIDPDIDGRFEMAGRKDNETGDVLATSRTWV